MPLHVDPDQNELRAIAAATDWRARKVIELGCGDGRLTLRLAGLGASVDAYDSEARLIRLARRQKPVRFAKRIRYHVGHAEHLPVRDGSVDRVVFAWSL